MSHIMKVILKRLDFLFVKMSCIHLLCCLLRFILPIFSLFFGLSEERMEEEMRREVKLAQ